MSESQLGRELNHNGVNGCPEGKTADITAGWRKRSRRITAFAASNACATKTTRYHSRNPGPLGSLYLPYHQHHDFVVKGSSDRWLRRHTYSKFSISIVS